MLHPAIGVHYLLWIGGCGQHLRYQGVRIERNRSDQLIQLVRSERRIVSWRGLLLRVSLRRRLLRVTLGRRLLGVLLLLRGIWLLRVLREQTLLAVRDEEERHSDRHECPEILADDVLISS